MRHFPKPSAVSLGLALLLASPVCRAEPDLNAIRAAHAALRDLSMTMVRTDVQDRELRRMKHADLALELARVRVWFEAPDKLRMEGKRGIVGITLIQNGNTKRIRYGIVRKQQDTTGKPDREQGGLDFGLLTSQVWTDFNVTRESAPKWEGRPSILLHVVARSSPHGSYHRVWVDEETLRVLQIEDRNGEGELKRRYVFRDPFKPTGGVWLARRIEIFNQYDRFVGAILLTDIVVNRGLDSSLFKL